MTRKKLNKKKKLFVSSSAAKSLSGYLLDEGMSEEQIENTLGQTISSLEEAEARLPVLEYHELWKQALEFTENPALGLELGAKPRNEEMGLVGHIFFNNATLGDALKQYERFYALVNEGMHIELKEMGELVKLEYICDVEDAYCIQDMERTLAIAMHRAKEYISSSLSIEYVGFQHDQPDYYDKYLDIFSCPVKFNQPSTHLVFKKKYLDFKLPKRSSYLHLVLTRHIESMLKRFRPKASLTDKVKSLVEKKLAKDSVDAEHIAERLHMSRNTLYRKLKQEGMSFHDLVDQVREKKALEYLNENKHSLSEIAFLLGFSELSAFSRAFKRWTGESPAKYSKQKV